MNNNKEGLYSSALAKILESEASAQHLERLTGDRQHLHFALHCNGVFMRRDGGWDFSTAAVLPFEEEFEGQKVSFFGPGSNDSFYSAKKPNYDLLIASLNQHHVLQTIGKFRQIDQDQAARIAFLLGGIVRELDATTEAPFWTPRAKRGKIKSAVSFAAQMTHLGEGKSGDAIASAMAMYVLSGGSTNLETRFMDDILKMKSAIVDDPVQPTQTANLGLSQVARLRNFWDAVHSSKSKPFPSLADFPEFKDFPTVGAEFHLPLSASTKIPDLWQRLAILNMSQYQKGSYIQLSRNDREVIEVRMNPSVYPVTIANWNHLRLLIPEVNHAYFTATINRNSAQDFTWIGNKQLLRKLQAVGFLCYAALNANLQPQDSKEEVNFGSVYLGQTVRIQGNREYLFTGNWRGGEGQHGQMGIYAGYGRNFPHLMYYPSMVLKNPDIIQFVQSTLSGIHTLKNALDMDPGLRKEIFKSIQLRIEADNTLGEALRASGKLYQQLKP